MKGNLIFSGFMLVMRRLCRGERRYHAKKRAEKGGWSIGERSPSPAPAPYHN
jgi:hypothetical protein